MINFGKAGKKAKKVAEDKERMMKLATAVINKLRKTDERNELIQTAREKISTFARMVRAFAAGEYRSIPWKSLTLIIAGLIYFVNPFDLIPDFIPGAGLMDDIAFILWIFNTVNEDLEAFNEWEANKSR